MIISENSTQNSPPDIENCGFQDDEKMKKDGCEPSEVFAVDH